MGLLLDKSFSVESSKLAVKPKVNLRLIGLFFIALFLMSALGVRLWYLQVYNYSYYKKKSEENRLRIIPVTPNRGLVFDRNGKVLIDNRASYSLFIYPVRITEEMEEKIELLSKKIDISSNLILKKLRYAGEYSPFPIEIKHDLSQETISFLLENRRDLPALTIEKDITRVLPNKKLASHILGYTGEISYSEIENNKDKYKVGDVIGKAGVERFFDDRLRGKKGGQYIEVDSIGRKIRTLKSTQSVSGEDIYLSIDMDLQKKVESLLEGKKAAAVVMDVNTGKILSMASKPDYDPNMFYRKMSKEEWSEVQKLSYPFLNRALSAFAPGSIFKIITSAAALEDGFTTKYRKFYSKGYLKVGGHTFWDWNPHGFGWVDIEKSLAYSIDTVYYELALEMGINNIKKYANMFGVGLKTGIDLMGEGKGVMPDQSWKRKYLKTPWYPGDSVNSSIGQGFILMTPLQAAVMTAATANGGKVLKPQIINYFGNKDKKELVRPEVIREIPLSKNTLNIVRKGLRDAVSYGTASSLRFKDLEAAAKTGSAEDPPRKKTHGWIVSYAPYKNPKYAVVVFVQNGGHGGEVAGPIAREIYKHLFDMKN